MQTAQQLKRTTNGSPARNGLLQRACSQHSTARGQAPLGTAGCSAGQPLEATALADRETRFVQDFSQVPVNRQSGAKADQTGAAYAPEAQLAAAPVVGQRGRHEETPGARTQAGVPPIVHKVLAQRGRPLDPDTRTFMEARFGHDFSRVQVHTNAVAAELARAVNALAYTAGHNVVFGAAQYAPASGAGQRLIAHELTHVVQQAALGTAMPAVGHTTAQAFQLGPADDPLEHQAQQAAASLGEHARSGGISGAPRARVQRQPITQAEGPGFGSGLGLPVLGLINLPSESLELEAGESLSAQNAKLIRAAQAFKSLQAGSPGANIKLSADLSEAAKMGSAKEAEERRGLYQRLTAARDALQSLGVPSDQMTIQPPTAYSTAARGQISVEVYKARQALPLIVPPSAQPAPTKGTPPQPQTAPGLPNLGDLLTLKFGPLTIELPKSIALKLPIPISTAKKLVIDLKAEASGTFSLSITLDGLRYVRVSVKAGASYDKDKGATGSAGLQIEMTRTVCHAANPEELKAKIGKAGEDLKKAMQEYSAAGSGGAEPDSDNKLLKLADIGSALGDMYDAVDKAKSACKQVPAATFEFGVKGPLGSETDPNKQQPSYIGGTITIPF